jgi:hypothetical protein
MDHELPDKIVSMEERQLYWGICERDIHPEVADLISKMYSRLVEIDAELRILRGEE